jgi:hypothetical protein
MSDDVDRVVVLHANTVVPLAFFEEVRKLVEEIVPGLERATNYTAEMLCGPDLWEPASAKRRQMAGMCVAFMVLQGMLPLVCSACRHRYPKLYRLK